jgi:hypothetical protein
MQSCWFIRRWFVPAWQFMCCWFSQLKSFFHHIALCMAFTCCMRTSARTHTHTYTYIHTYIHTYTHIHIHTHTHIHTYTHTYTHIFHKHQVLEFVFSFYTYDFIQHLIHIQWCKTDTALFVVELSSKELLTTVCMFSYIYSRCTWFWPGNLLSGKLNFSDLPLEQHCSMYSIFK